MKKICIIEDDLWIAKSLKLYLENSDFEVILFHSWEAADEFVIQQNPQLVILDINLPWKNGIEVCSKIREYSQVPIIMLTARNSENDRVTGLESWADDYIAKPFSPRELLARIHSILRRTQDESEVLDQNILLYNGLRAEIDTMRVFDENNREIQLTKNEYDILIKIWQAQGRLVTREALMKEVIGYDNYMYDRTIDTHIKNVRKKLSQKDMILTLRGKWYRLNV